MVGERALHWYCAECREWAICDDHDLCIACGGARFEGWRTPA